MQGLGAKAPKSVRSYPLAEANGKSDLRSEVSVYAMKIATRG
jgi:hypothetical protein